MGLTVSHGCWNGGYHSFAIWRAEVARAAGFPPLDEMDGYTEGKGRSWDPFKDDPLTVLLSHHDNRGTIRSEACGPLADRLEALLPQLPTTGIEKPPSRGGWLVPNPPHVLDDWQGTTRRFIEGLRRAAKSGEEVVFR